MNVGQSFKTVTSFYQRNEQTEKKDEGKEKKCGPEDAIVNVGCSGFSDNFHGENEKGSQE